MIALVLMLAMAAPVQSHDWRGITDDGWTFRLQSDSPRSLLFTQPANRGEARIWVRLEYPAMTPGLQGFRSSRALVVADCSEGRLKSIQTTNFRRSNLGGAAVQRAADDEWFYPAPGTPFESVLNLVCEPESAE